MRLIDADLLNRKMYHEAFETDTDLQKWESGCWIRYKMFENAIDNVPTVNAVPLSVIEDIKAEIKSLYDEPARYVPNYDAYAQWLEIIDKHISGKENTDESSD